MTLARRLAAALAASEGDARASFGDQGAPVLDPSTPLLDAAVLVAITDRAEPGVILTRRNATLRRHAGQIAFPGGRIDPGENATTAALREAEEEIALPRASVTLVGSIAGYRTGTGYHVVPVIGVVPADLILVPSEAEVADVFEVPLAFLFDPANHRVASAAWQGRTRHFVEILWQDRRIWGATAAMIVNLSYRLQAA